MSEQAALQTQTRVKPAIVQIASGLMQCCTATTECDDCRKKREGNLQRAAINPSPVHEVPPIVHEVLRSPGQPLDPATRAFMEPRFGHDFSSVRVHTDAKAAESAQAVNALAYTVGRNVVFGTGKYAPTSNAGQRLLAHELTHTMQQHGIESPTPLHTDTVDACGEREAETVASRVLMGLSADVRGRSETIQFYGHASHCEQKPHLEGFIWPGHDHAKKITRRALEETDGRKLNSKVGTYLRTYFGTNSADPGNVQKIHANFEKINAALNQEYLYHCSQKGNRADKEAKTCKGQNAETDQSGRKDITLCFDQVKDWTVPEAAWLIVHENAHRGLDVWGHTWEAGNATRCVTKQPSQAALDLDNPDSYACFAVLMWELGTP